MSDHEFEKQVRQKLNDLKITPSTESWENIENKLRERKRRPVAFYWIPLLLVGLAAGGYLFLNTEHHKTFLSDKNSTPGVNTQTKDAASQENKVAVQEHTSALQENTEAPQENIALQKNTAAPQIQSAAPQNNSNKSDSPLKEVPNDKIVVLQQESVVSRRSSGVANGNASGGLLKDFSDEYNVHRKNLSLKVSNYPIGSINPSPLNFIQSPKETTAKKTDKWSYGLSAFVGISAVNEGHILNFNNALVEDVSLVPSFAPRPSFKPSSISPGIAYSAGIFVKRELSRKFSISVGANYLQLNTRSKVGDREIGSQVVNAGSNGYQFVYNYFRVERDKPTDYHNRYHFIELPVELHTRLNKSHKIPIQLTTGIAVSQLLKSSSLHFDGTTGVYYKDDRLLNQTQFAAKTGVSVGILNKTKRPLWIGPSAKYNVSKILKKDVSTRTNFMSLGVDVKLFIK